MAAHPAGLSPSGLLRRRASLSARWAAPRRLWYFYGANFVGPSGMVSGLLSILYKDFGQGDRAETFFANAHSGNVNGPFLVWSEGPANQGWLDLPENAESYCPI